MEKTVKIVRFQATPVRPPANYHASAAWLSESLVANPVSLPEDRDTRSLFPYRRGLPQPVDGSLTPSDARGLGVDVESSWRDE